ncbi:substrate-binding periplasmic protein [Spirochaeta isovalerica]|uniref:Polar amino acid transport system substrate-binding protein n=1 Tax=Spirochaeta isovalerica TaxID=150 RepID=A0A841RBV6_9SPIO|nr:transporter substrate-binding domain-containing protein [Spirochaeta isovalerica]MBB6481176.1 polar amino acid transport system substrate-binding protein [Spirochaeta isovalerica]
MKPVLILFVLFLLLAPTGVFADKDREEKILIYSTNPLYPPYDWAVDENTFAGAAVELLERVIPPGVMLQPAVFPWKRAMLLAENGEIDLLMPLRITPERSEYLNFLPNRAFRNPIVVFKLKRRDISLSEFSDLKPYVGGVSRGDTFGGGFDEYWRSELTMEVADTMAQNFRKLEFGRIDYFVTGYYTGMTYLKKNNLDLNIEAMDYKISDVFIHFGFSKMYRDEAVMNYINDQLGELNSTGETDSLLMKYIDVYNENENEYLP